MGRLSILFVSFFVTAILFTGSGFAQNDKTELFVQTGHSEEINEVAISADGRYVGTASADKTVIIWDVRTGKQLAEFDDRKSEVYSMDISSDGKFAAAAYWDSYVVIWDLVKCEKIKEFKAHYSNALRLKFTPNGKHLITAGQDPLNISLKIWETANYTELNKVQLDVAYLEPRLMVSPDNKRVIIAIPFNQILDLDIATGTVKHNLKLKKDQPSSVFVLSNDGKHVFYSDGTIVKVNIATGEVVKKTPVSGSWDWMITADEKSVIREGGDGCEVYDIETGTKLQPLEMVGLDEFGFEGAYRHPSNPNRIVSVHGHERLVMWDLALHAPIRVFQGKSQQVMNISYHPDKPIIAIASAVERPMIIDLAKAEMVEHYDQHKAFVRSIDFRKGTNQVASCGVYEELHIYDYESMKSVKVIEAPEDYFKLRYSPDGKYLVGCRDDGVVEIINPDTGEKLHELKGHTETVLDVAFLTDGRCVTTSMDFQVLVWNMVKGKLITVLKERHSGGGRLASIPGKELLAVTYGYMIEVYDMKMYKKLKSLNSGDFSRAFYHAECSKDGKWLAGACFGGAAVIWNVDTWERRVIERAHKNTVSAIAFSNDSKKLITGGYDGKVIIWNVENLKEEASIVCTSISDFVISTPDNYYTATKGALQYVGFRVKGKIYPFEQFDLKFNRPDKVIEELAYANPFLKQMYYLAYKKRLKRLGFTEEMLGSDYNLPTAMVKDYEKLKFSSESSTYSFTLQAKDQLYKLGRVSVSINGVPVRNEVLKTPSQELEMPLSVELGEGLNQIELTVLNSKGVRSNSIRHDVAYKPQEKVKRKLYVLSCGVSKYKDSEWDLTYAAKDSKDLANLYSSYNGSHFDEVKVVNLTDAEVTVERVKREGDVFKDISVNDHVIVYYSSHGLLADNLDYYLATRDVNFYNPAEGGLQYEVLEKIMSQTKSRNKLLLIDACHSGELDKENISMEPVASNDEVGGQVKGVAINAQKKGGGGKSGLKNSFSYMKALFADLSRGSGATIISAAGGLEFAYESARWHNGVFTYSILQGLQQPQDKIEDKIVYRAYGSPMNTNSDDFISVNELRTYVTRRVSTLTRGKQTPTTRNQNLINDFIIY